MILYAESSAVLAWLFAEPRGKATRALLSDAEMVVASVLTVLECERVITRARATSVIGRADETRMRSTLLQAARHWTLLELSDDVLAGAARPFPTEPVRTLDAIHVASAVLGRTAIPELALLSLDDRVRRAGRGLEFPLLPAGDN